MRILLIYPNTMMSTLVPLHFSVLAACLKKEGVKVDLFDTTLYKTEKESFEEGRVELLQIKPFNLAEKGITLKGADVYEDLKKRVIVFKPDLIGITIVEDTWDLAQSLLESIKEFDIPVIAGGVHVTAVPDEIISNKNIDMICLGEGEEALVELCQKMAKQKDYTNVKNLWFKKDGKILKNSLRPLTDINKLPYIDYDVWGKERLARPMFGKIYTMIHVEIDRGCPNQCTYCAAPYLKKVFLEQGCGHYYRRKAISRLIAELEYLVSKYKPDYINFNSETFLAKPLKELQEFARAYKKKIHLPFWAQTRPETITEEKIKILKAMGVDSMNFGIEHGNEDFRKKMLRRYGSNKQIIEGLKLVDKYQIPYTVNNIIGFPGETRSLIFDTIELNRKLHSRTINVLLFVPYKGTFLYKYCVENGYLDKDVRLNGHPMIEGVKLKMASISYEELKGLHRTFNLYVRFPKSEWRKIKRAERFDDEGNKVFEEYKKIYQEKYF